ncbi:MAG: polysaccharide deacetylase family protein [Bacillota bacterium]|nr:polysaccharide deacetylase family protein [Bacillota bacterium]
MLIGGLAGCTSPAQPAAVLPAHGTPATEPSPEETPPSTPPLSPENQRLADLGLALYPEEPEKGPLPANEKGRIMVLMYHRITDDGKDQRWTRTPEDFRHDLEILYERGYRPINARQFIDADWDVPPGYTPVVLTFDDSTPGQLAFTPGEPPQTLEEAVARLDPDSAVGILVAFHQRHPDWKLRATFFVNGNALFGVPAEEKIKLELLDALGFEIGNHTYSHASLKNISAEATAKEMGLNQKVVQDLVPGYKLRTLALPYGIWPHHMDEALSGTYEGIPYENEAFFLVGSNPALPPGDPKYDPYRIPRIQVVDEALQLDTTFPYTWLGYFDRHPENRFVKGD